MGHGTSHTAKVSYSQMQTAMQTLGYDNVFIGTVEGEPESTSCENVIEAVKAAGYTKVVLRPLIDVYKRQAWKPGARIVRSLLPWTMKITFPFRWMIPRSFCTMIWK